MPSRISAKRAKVRATVRLPRPLYEKARKLVGSELSATDNFNEFLIAALSLYVKLLERKQIDAAFAAMAEDAEFQKEAKRIAEDFSASDWEALELTERDGVEV